MSRVLIAIAVFAVVLSMMYNNHRVTVAEAHAQEAVQKTIHVLQRQLDEARALNHREHMEANMAIAYVVRSAMYNSMNPSGSASYQAIDYGPAEIETFKRIGFVPAPMIGSS